MDVDTLTITIPRIWTPVGRLVMRLSALLLCCLSVVVIGIHAWELDYTSNPLRWAMQEVTEKGWRYQSIRSPSLERKVHIFSIIAGGLSILFLLTVLSVYQYLAPPKAPNCACVQPQQRKTVRAAWVWGLIGLGTLPVAIMAPVACILTITIALRYDQVCWYKLSDAMKDTTWGGFYRGGQSFDLERWSCSLAYDTLGGPIRPVSREFHRARHLCDVGMAGRYMLFALCLGLVLFSMISWFAFRGLPMWKQSEGQNEHGTEVEYEPLNLSWVRFKGTLKGFPKGLPMWKKSEARDEHGTEDEHEALDPKDEGRIQLS